MNTNQKLGSDIINLFQEADADPKVALQILAGLAMSTITVIAQDSDNDTASEMGKLAAGFVNDLHETAAEILMNNLHA